MLPHQGRSQSPSGLSQSFRGSAHRDPTRQASLPSTSSPSHRAPAPPRPSPPRLHPCLDYFSPSIPCFFLSLRRGGTERGAMVGPGWTRASEGQPFRIPPVRPASLPLLARSAVPPPFLGQPLPTATRPPVLGIILSLHPILLLVIAERKGGRREVQWSGQAGPELPRVSPSGSHPSGQPPFHFWPAQPFPRPPPVSPSPPPPVRPCLG